MEEKLSYEKRLISDEVIKENNARLIKNKVVPKILEDVKTLLNLNILKVDGSILKKYSDLLEVDLKPFEAQLKPLRVGGVIKIHYAYIKAQYNTLSLNFSVSYSGGSYENKTYYCQYKDSVVYLADMEKGIIKKLLEFEQLPFLDYEKEVAFYESALIQGEAFKLAKDYMYFELRAKLFNRF